MTPESLGNVVEAALLAAGRALTLDDFLALFAGSADAPDRKQLRDALAQLDEDLSGRGIELVEVASGYRLQVRKEYSSWLAGLFSERPPRYSRALLETLALITYRQPITRGEIEDVRGVAVSSNIIKTLMEREWIRVLGHREVPGRPALYGTTREFLDHFGLKSLEGLPPLADIRDLDQVAPDLFAPAPADVGDSELQNGDDGLPSSRSEADSGNDAPADEEEHDHGSVVEDEQQSSQESAAENATVDGGMADESAVNEADSDETQVVEAAANVDLGDGELDTLSDDDASLVVGQPNDSDDVPVAGGDSETASSVDESLDADVDLGGGDLETGLDDDVSSAAGQSDDADNVPVAGGDSETSLSVDESLDADVDLGGGDLETGLDDGVLSAAGQFDDADNVPGEGSDSETSLSVDESVDADVDLGGGDLETGLDDDVSPAIGQSNDADNVPVADGDSETSSSVDESVDADVDLGGGDLETGLDDDVSPAAGQSDDADNVPDEDGNSETSLSVDEAVDANVALVVSRSDDENVDDYNDQGEAVNAHIDETDRGEFDGRR
jgi:segregation and condensation protein B